MKGSIVFPLLVFPLDLIKFNFFVVVPMLLESDISTKYVHVKWMKMNDSKMARFFSKKKKNLGGPSASVVYNGLDKLSFDVKIPFKKNLLSTLHNELKPR